MRFAAVALDLVGLRRLVATLLVLDEMIRAVERDYGGFVVDDGFEVDRSGPELMQIS